MGWRSTAVVLRIKLGDYRTVTGDPLGRSYIGYFPRMTEAEAWEAGRGMWKLSARTVARERFAMIVGDGRVRAIAEIGAVVPVDDRKALTGELLTAGHPLYDAYIGTPDPLANDSQNSITYGDLPGEVELRLRPCGCGCGQDTERDFVPGHEMRAIQQRVRVHFDGSTTAFLAWLDAALHSERTASSARAVGR
jgi:hypothetical protein